MIPVKAKKKARAIHAQPLREMVSKNLSEFFQRKISMQSEAPSIRQKQNTSAGATAIRANTEAWETLKIEMK